MGSAADASTALAAGRGSAARPGVGTVLLVFLAVLMTIGVVGYGAKTGLLAWDVRFAYLPAADAVLDGDSPYPALDDPILEDQKGYVYPPQLVLALVPLTPLPIDVSAVLVTLGLLALLGLTLRIVGVRDVRCYAAAVLWVPSVSALLLGNVSIPLAFAAAVAWRYRDTVRRPAWALGLAVSAKLLMWPLLVWTAATRRFALTIWALVIGVCAALGAWALIGFDGLTGVPGSAPAPVGDPVGAQLLARRYGRDGRAAGGGRQGAHGRAWASGSSAAAWRSRDAATTRGRSRAPWPRRSR